MTKDGIGPLLALPATVAHTYQLPAEILLVRLRLQAGRLIEAHDPQAALDSDRTTLVGDKRRSRWVRDYSAPDDRISSIRFLDHKANGEWDRRSGNGHGDRYQDPVNEPEASPKARPPALYPTVEAAAAATAQSDCTPSANAGTPSHATHTAAARVSSCRWPDTATADR